MPAAAGDSELRKGNHEVAARLYAEAADGIGLQRMPGIAGYIDRVEEAAAAALAQVETLANPPRRDVPQAVSHWQPWSRP